MNLQSLKRYFSFLSLISIVAVMTGCGASQREQDAVKRIMQSVDQALKAGDMNAIEMELKGIDATEAPEDFQLAFLELKNEVHAYNLSPAYKTPDGEKFDTMKFLKWHEKKSVPFQEAYAVLELKAGEYVPEIKERIGKRAQFRGEMNDFLKKQREN